MRHLRRRHLPDGRCAKEWISNPLRPDRKGGLTAQSGQSPRASHRGHAQRRMGRLVQRRHLPDGRCSEEWISNPLRPDRKGGLTAQSARSPHGSRRGHAQRSKARRRGKLVQRRHLPDGRCSEERISDREGGLAAQTTRSPRASRRGQAQRSKARRRGQLVQRRHLPDGRRSEEGVIA